MRRLFPLIAATALAALCACQTPPEPPPLIPPPPPPEPPPILYVPKEKAFGAAFIDEAAAFHQAMTAAAGVSPAFTDGQQVAGALRVAASHEPKQMQRGAVAYVAALALSQKDFTDSFRQYSVDKAGREELVAKLIERPDYAGTFPGGDKAAGLAISQLDALGGAAWRNGRAVILSAYEVQKQPWSKQPVPERDVRLAEAKTLSARRLIATAEMSAKLRATALTDAPADQTVAPASSPYTGLVNRGLALAAIAALGEAGDDKAEALSALLDDPITADCLTVSKLMLFQCLAGSDRGHYEDIFCLGEHAISDTGRCFAVAANAATPSYTPPPPPPPPAKAAPKAEAKAPARRAPARKR